jgi:uncharacterized membrane-anchored protein YitT (DUF2179 family)
MAAIIYIILPVLLTGLGFVSYKHPQIARKIIAILFALNFIILIIGTATYSSRISAYSESWQIVNKNQLDSFPITADAVNKKDFNLDSAKRIVSESLKVIEMKRNLILSINNGIERKEHEANESKNSFQFWSLIAFATLVCFLILSILFNNVHNKK